MSYMFYMVSKAVVPSACFSAPNLTPYTSHRVRVRVRVRVRKI